MKTLTGIVRGRTIELTEAPEVAEGQRVLVQMTIVRDSAQDERPPQNEFDTVEDRRIFDEIQQDRSTARFGGLLTTEGALADDDEWDAIMDEIHQCRRWERTSGSGDQ